MIEAHVCAEVRKHVGCAEVRKHLGVLFVSFLLSFSLSLSLFLGPSWTPLGAFLGASWGSLGGSWGPRGALVGLSWGSLGSPGGPLGAILEAIDQRRGVLYVLPPLGPSKSPLGVPLGRS